MFIFNGSPEGKILLRNMFWIVLFVCGSIIAPHAVTDGRLNVVLCVGMLASARVIGLAPRRFTYASATTRLRLVWYTFIGEIVVLAVAFVFALNDAGDPRIAWSLLILALVLEIANSTAEGREHRRVLRPIPRLKAHSLGNDWDFAMLPATAADALYQAVAAQAFARVATVKRAYLARQSSSPQDAPTRVVALRFAFPWSDEDALALALDVFQKLGARGTYARGAQLIVVMLDDASERQIRTITEPFYDRDTNLQAVVDTDPV